MEPRINFHDVPKGWYELLQNIEMYLKNSGISHTLIYLIKNRASQINRCGYCLDMHNKDAVKAGETAQRIYLLPAWKESPVYSDTERAVINLTEVVTRISDSEPEVVKDAFDQVSAHFSKAEVANLVLAIGQINTWNRVAITFGAIPGTYGDAQQGEKKPVEALSTKN